MASKPQQPAPALSGQAEPPFAPAFPEIGVIALVPDTWHWLWQPRHQVMTRLARYFHVAWMNPAEDWRESLSPRRLFSRTKASEVPLPAEGFIVNTPSPWLPLCYRPATLARFLFRRRLRRARQILLDRGCKKIVLYLWRPEFSPALDLLPADLACYHIDDEYSFSAVDTPVSDQEQRLIARSGQVFIHSPALLEKKGSINPNTAFAPNGVDFSLYARPGSEPADLASIPRPRIGYTGHIKRQLDWPLLVALALRHPEWNFVFVGPTNPHPEIKSFLDQLSAMPNVRFLGGKSVMQLAEYPKHFDVCLMPYVLDNYTKYIYPLKLHEYLASGRPVVGSSIESLKKFKDVVLLPQGVDEWSQSIAAALTPALSTPAASSARQAVARRHDWNTIVRRIAGLIALRLGHPSAASLAGESDELPPREATTSISESLQHVLEGKRAN